VRILNEDRRNVNSLLLLLLIRRYSFEYIVLMISMSAHIRTHARAHTRLQNCSTIRLDSLFAAPADAAPNGNNATSFADDSEIKSVIALILMQAVRTEDPVRIAIFALCFFI
jgi:hypothetical protein